MHQNAPVDIQLAYYRQIIDTLNEEVQELLKTCKKISTHIPQRERTLYIQQLREIVHFASRKMDFINKHEVKKGEKLH